MKLTVKALKKIVTEALASPDLSGTAKLMKAYAQQHGLVYEEDTSDGDGQPLVAAISYGSTGASIPHGGDQCMQLYTNGALTVDQFSPELEDAGEWEDDWEYVALTTPARLAKAVSSGEQIHGLGPAALGPAGPGAIEVPDPYADE